VSVPDDQLPPLPPERPVALEPLPQSVRIAPGLIEGWEATPLNRKVAVELTRGDLDRLYASVNRCIEAQAIFQDSMIDHSNGQFDLANAKLRQSQRRLIEAQNALREFMSAVMASALLGNRA